jgi:hypothetical protein
VPTVFTATATVPEDQLKRRGGRQCALCLLYCCRTQILWCIAPTATASLPPARIPTCPLHTFHCVHCVLGPTGRSDFAILEIGETIPDDYNVYLNGWDASGDKPDSVIGVHHPSGDIKKVHYEFTL